MLYCYHNWFSYLEILRETRISISQWKTDYSTKEQILTRLLYYMYIVHCTDDPTGLTHRLLATCHCVYAKTLTRISSKTPTGVSICCCSQIFVLLLNLFFSLNVYRFMDSIDQYQRSKDMSVACMCIQYIKPGFYVYTRTGDVFYAIWVFSN